MLVWRSGRFHSHMCCYLVAHDPLMLALAFFHFAHCMLCGHGGCRSPAPFGRPSSPATFSSSPTFGRLRLDVVLDRPFVVVPEGSASPRVVLANLGTLTITNKFDSVQVSRSRRCRGSN